MRCPAVRGPFVLEVFGVQSGELLDVAAPGAWLEALMISPLRQGVNETVGLRVVARKPGHAAGLAHIFAVIILSEAW
jgi:hypothetical protein